MKTGVRSVGLGLWIFDSRLEMDSASKLITDMIVGRFECLLSQVMDKINANQEKAEVSQAQMKASQEELRDTVRTGQENGGCNKRHSSYSNEI
jgi:hypothetical protein